MQTLNYFVSDQVSIHSSTCKNKIPYEKFDPISYYGSGFLLGTGRSDIINSGATDTKVKKGLLC